MSGLQNKPLTNRDPSLDSSVVGGFRQLFELHDLTRDHLLPAKVLSFNREKNVATVQPLVMLIDMNDTPRLRPTIADIPVLSLGGGGFHISFPLKPGDIGWIQAADRDISLFMQTLDTAKPNTLRKSKFSDSWFVPDVFRQYVINAEDAGAMVIQTTSGSTRIAISEGIINITAPTSVKIDTPMATFTKDVHIQGNLSVDKNATVTGMTQVNGGFAAAGGQVCTLPNTTTVGGISVYGHGHIETNAAGGRTSGGMVA